MSALRSTPMASLPHCKSVKLNQQTPRMLPNSPATLELPSSSDNLGAETPKSATASYESAAQILAHPRATGAAPATPRVVAPPPVLRAPRRERRKLRVLVPGAGLSRLAYEIARLGHASKPPT